MLRGIRYELRDYEAQSFATLAWQFTRVNRDLATDAQRI
jgi:hypothetical protein